MKLTNLIEKLSAFEPDGQTFLSIYLDARSGDDGRDEYQSWIKKELSQQTKDFGEESDEARGFASMAERLREFFSADVEPSANGIAIFAHMGGEFFESIQIDEPFPHNRFFLFDRPHVFPLVRMNENNPQYAVLWADTNKADIYVFGGENAINVEIETKAKIEEIQNDKSNRSQVGGFSQAHYQRRIDNFHLQHAKETVEELEKLMTQANIEYLVLCGDETAIMPVLRPQLSKATEERVIATLNMSQYASEQEIREATREIMRAENATKDKAGVERLFDAARSAAQLGTLGVDKTLAALSNGQVEELFITSVFDGIKYNTKMVENVLAAYAPRDDNSGSGELPEPSEKRQIADELIIRALNSAAKITFIEDESLLEEAGGVGAVLRYNMNADAVGS